MAFGIPVSMLGIWVKGDLAGQTIYTDRFGHKVFFPQAPPDKPPSPMQVKQRARFQTAITNWKATTQANRNAFEQLSLRCSLCMTGHNLWIHVSLQSAFALLETLQRQAGIAVTPPAPVPWPA